MDADLVAWARWMYSLYSLGVRITLEGAESDKFEVAHLLKRRGGDYAGDWVIEKAGSCRLGCGLVQQDAIGPTDRVGFRNGLKGPQLIGLKSDPVRRPKTQKFKCGMKERVEVQQARSHTDKEVSRYGQSGSVLLGPKQFELVKILKAQKQGQRGFRRRKRGSKAVSLGPKVALTCSKDETRFEGEGVRSGEKGLSQSDPLVDLAWICV